MKSLKALKTLQKKIDVLQDQQTALAMRYIEAEAKKIMTLYPELTIYYQGMGSWSFYDFCRTPVGEVDGVNLDADTLIAQIFLEYDEHLHLSGVPMKIEKDMSTGEFTINTDW